MRKKDGASFGGVSADAERNPNPANASEEKSLALGD
jgi:hypothetical protein